MKLPKSKKRVPVNRLIKPDSLKLLKSLAKALDLSEGQTLDRAVAALAVAESFGGNHLNLKSRKAAK